VFASNWLLRHKFSRHLHNKPLRAMAERAVSELYVGLMSGTSLDGVDAVLADFAGAQPQVLAHSTVDFSAELRAELLSLNAPGPNELHRAWLAGNALARRYAHAVELVLQQAGVAAAQVRALGAHGQTVRHRPQEFDGTGYTIQLNQPALLAELTGMDVVADFRSRDVAAGGQGAPLVPPFHQAFFGGLGTATVVLNIGGISNLTVIADEANGTPLGYDCGPGNALIDGWCAQHCGTPYDDAGQWARGGSVIPDLLTAMLQEPFFARPAPKSTGRDLFNMPWLECYLQPFQSAAAHDVQATLAELTAVSCAHSIQSAMPHCPTLIVCGGGALNTNLMERLQHTLPHCSVQSSDAFGLPPLQVEATAFAWLARQTVLGRTGSLAEVTGATGARVLGAVYPT
jgi:anhydro-N-acetylmuramic acid kinase